MWSASNDPAPVGAPRQLSRQGRTPASLHTTALPATNGIAEPARPAKPIVALGNHPNPPAGGILTTDQQPQMHVTPVPSPQSVCGWRDTQRSDATTTKPDKPNVNLGKPPSRIDATALPRRTTTALLTRPASCVAHSQRRQQNVARREHAGIRHRVASPSGRGRPIRSAHAAAAQQAEGNSETCSPLRRQSRRGAVRRSRLGLGGRSADVRRRLYAWWSAVRVLRG